MAEAALALATTNLVALDVIVSGQATAISGLGTNVGALNTAVGAQGDKIVILMN